jgi:hypothetical protein
MKLKKKKSVLIGHEAGGVRVAKAVSVGTTVDAFPRIAHFCWLTVIVLGTRSVNITKTDF